MIIKSEYSLSFHSDMLTKRKYMALKQHAESLLSIRNELSALVNSNSLKYMQMTNIDFQKEMLPLIKDRVHSNFTKQLCDDIITCYDNRFKAVQKKMMFERVTSIEMIFYKRDTKHNRKGDFKEVRRKTESTPLTKVLSFLARYGNDSTIKYFERGILNDINVSRKKFYAQVLDYINRFGFDRLMNIALLKRKRILDKYREPICFKSLTFRGRSRLSTDILSYNRNFNSVIKAFVCFSWTETHSCIKIPVKYSKKWHGSMSIYSNGTDTSYTITFDPYKTSIRVILFHEGKREYPDAKIESDKYVGFDVNSKHNQFTGSNGVIVDHDRGTLNTLIKELLYTDELKSKIPNYQPGKRRTIKIGTLRRQIKHHTERNCSDICKYMIEQGDNHAVFEDLDNGFGKTFVKTEDDFNYNRLIREMHLSSIKNEFEHIARKHKIIVSIVHSEYTSQECSDCGCIDERNRKTQEEFECIECGHKEDADSNSSKNIKRRVSEAVLRDCLLVRNKLGNGSYSPKGLPIYRVKEMLLSLRYKVHKPKESTQLA